MTTTKSVVRARQKIAADPWLGHTCKARLSHIYSHVGRSTMMEILGRGVRLMIFSYALETGGGYSAAPANVVPCPGIGCPWRRRSCTGFGF
eukprot:scaffold1341_cov178-Amphora_coffeaeformis.AAC.3